MKRPKESYLTMLVDEGLTVDTFIERLRTAGFLCDGELIYLGAASSWIFKGTYDEYKDKITDLNIKYMDASEKGYKAADKAVIKMINDPVQIEHDLMVYANNLIAYGNNLKNAVKERNKFKENIQLGVFNGRKVIESYNTTYTDKGDVMIRVEGHEVGKEW